ncbi:hypothetical protein COCSADRAFT_37456 [Bipolaris sorokiniana ND90Pr]|uniref:Putative zinc-finger domain-containing protein n=1 Tax=Cochliobolus sativus (strain ND90Pr / ATCC 201652) TaxID=665912 RepID=M2T3V3_COCSN|nr:uncharacterized protein COCSADRAFT_37456 [Bipolaris sorokiniana ND90Pr]EMD63687.1 hypothetical protein COCSADRAFT_37456 [Bipolaris sorokiniana ND90Pr]
MPPPQGAPPEEQRAAPPLQQLPGINFNSYAHNSQQPPFPAPSWPPQLPPDANIWALFQNGAFPPPNLPPPPFPTMGFPPPSLPQTPQNIPPPTRFPQSLPQRPPHPPALHQPPAPAPAFTTAPPPTNERIQGIMDSDREDGELSEGDMASHPPPPVHINGGRPPTSAVQHNGLSNKTAVKQQENQNTLLEKLQQDRESARQFIKLLHSNNIPYRTLADEKLDAELLRGLYQSVNLPSEPAPILPPKPNGTTSSAPAVQPIAAPQQKTVPTLKTSAIPAPSTKAAASPTTPGDRKDYIARLQAAKAAKQAASSKTTSPSQSITPAKPRTPQPISTPTTKPPVTDEQRARNTELIKQRLEAIKARQKAPNGVSNNTTQASVPLQQTPQAQVAQPTPSGLATPTSQSYTPSFSGIPGLFMSHTPVSNNTAPTPSQPSLSMPQKPPTSKNEASVSRESTTPYTRPLGQSTNTHQEDDSMIIEVSEDESNGSDMDIDDEPPAPPALPRKPGIPVRPAFPATPADNAPGSQTPSTLAREKELVDKEKQLVAMRETLKRKLAEKRERDRLASSSAAAVSSPTTQKPSTPVLPPQNRTPSKDPSTVVRDTARSRRAEIQSKLPTLDAEIASNTNRMAELAKELEQLTALNNKIARDKEQLTKELELLGVDTEGMSHAELRAKKDEIEREQSPEPNASSQNADRASRSSMTASSLAIQPSLEPSSPKSSVPSSQPPSAQPFQKHAILPGLGQSISQAQHQYHAVTNQTHLHQRLETMSNGNGAAQTAEDDYARASRSQSSVIASDRDMGEDFYSPTPPAEKDVAAQPASSNTDVASTPAVAQPSAAPSPSEGEVEMSVSEGEDDEEEEEYEPEYDPEEHAAVGNASTEEPHDSQLNVAPSITTSYMSAEDEEAYEPPEADQDMADVPNETATSDSVPQARQTEADDGAMDIATSSDDSSDDSDSDEESESDSEADDIISGNNLAHQDNNVADDLAPELQPQTISVVDNVQPAPTLDEEEESAPFKPYQSPLRMFKSYRYHPSYSKDVSGGFMSLTFSHQIDPEKPFCQYESAGGACNDPECPDQHFRDATITGALSNKRSFYH